MEQFWDIVSNWDRLGQGVFFLITFGGLLTLTQRVVYYLTVMLRGWPEREGAD